MNHLCVSAPHSIECSRSTLEQVMLSPALTRFIVNVYLVALMRENCQTQFAECRIYGVQIKLVTNMPTLKLQSHKSDVDANGKLILLDCATFVFSKVLNSIGFHLVPFFVFDNHISHENSSPRTRTSKTVHKQYFH